MSRSLGPTVPQGSLHGIEDTPNDEITGRTRPPPSSGRGELPFILPLTLESFTHLQVQAVPEIRHTHPSSDRGTQYTRSIYDSSRAPTQFPEARSLAPSPLVTSKTRPQYTVSYSSNGSMNSPDEYRYSNGSGRRGSYASSSSSGTLPELTRGGNPILPPVASTHLPIRNVSDRPSRDPCSLPPIYSNGTSNGSTLNPHRHAVPPQPTQMPIRRNPSPPRQMAYPPYNGVPHPDYSYHSGQYMERPPFNNGSGNGNYPLSFDAGSDYGDPKQKRRRGNLPKAVTDTLRVWFTNHVGHPYPTEEEKQELMSLTGLTISQVSSKLYEYRFTRQRANTFLQISNWFINARRRSLPQMTKQAQAEAEIREQQNGSSGSARGDDYRGRHR